MFILSLNPFFLSVLLQYHANKTIISPLSFTKRSSGAPIPVFCCLRQQKLPVTFKTDYTQDNNYPTWPVTEKCVTSSIFREPLTIISVLSRAFIVHHLVSGVCQLRNFPIIGHEKRPLSTSIPPHTGPIFEMLVSTAVFPFFLGFRIQRPEFLGQTFHFNPLETSPAGFNHGAYGRRSLIGPIMGPTKTTP